MERIKKDVEFLADHNLMDYSLLLGVEKVSKKNKVQRDSEGKLGS